MRPTKTAPADINRLYGKPKTWHDGHADDYNRFVEEHAHRVNGVLLRCPDGAFDEIVARGDVHIEVMTPQALALSVNGIHVSIDAAPNGHLRYALWAEAYRPLHNRCARWAARLLRFVPRRRRRAHRRHGKHA